MALRNPPLEQNFTHIFSRPAVSFEEEPTKIPKVTVETQARHQPGIELIPDEVEEFTSEMYRDFISFFAQQYKNNLKEAILNQEFVNNPLPDRYGGGRWPPLSRDYKRWKEKNNLPGKDMMWLRSGQLIDAIKVHFFPQVGDNGAWSIGIPSTAKFRKVETTGRGWRLGEKTDTEILAIARILEFGAGGANIPPRPLFRPIKSRTLKNVRNIFEDWANQTGKV